VLETFRSGETAGSETRAERGPRETRVERFAVAGLPTEPRGAAIRFMKRLPSRMRRTTCLLNGSPYSDPT